VNLTETDASLMLIDGVMLLWFLLTALSVVFVSAPAGAGHDRDLIRRAGDRRGDRLDLRQRPLACGLGGRGPQGATGRLGAALI
jgi:hypothetical protein